MTYDWERIDLDRRIEEAHESARIAERRSRIAARQLAEDTFSETSDLQQQINALSERLAKLEAKESEGAL